MPLNNQDFQQFCSDLSTIRDCLRYCVSTFENNDLFYGHGTDNAWDEALVLLQYFTKLPVDKLELVLDAKLTLAEKQKLYKLIDQRVNQRVPLPYITNEAWFCDMGFYVDHNVLIPRSPIAELINNNFEPWLDLDKDVAVLEIGTGSGCIACAIAENFLEQGIEVQVDASDISDSALKIAGQNVAEHELEDTVNLIKSDLFENIPNKQYDLIISNPPYVDADEMTNLPAEYLHEPRMALAAGEDGLELVDIMLKQAQNYLNQDGVLIVEVGASKPALMEKYPEVEFIWFDFINGGDGIFLLSYDELSKIN